MRKFFLDTILCTAFIFSLIGLFSSITYFRVFDLFDPVGEMFSDFELTDMVMSNIRDVPEASEDIVIVNIGHLDRAGIAEQISILSAYQPAVIGVDITLETRKTYAEDSLLIAVLKRHNNVVVGDKLVDFNMESNQFDSLLRPEKRLAQEVQFGFVNLVTDAANQDDLKACRVINTHQTVNGKRHLAFPVKLAQFKDSLAVQKLLARDSELETINYKGNIMGMSNFGTRYYVLDVADVFDQNFTPDLIRDKVVIMCFLGAYLGDRQTRTDLYFTPLNERYVGKAEPDMFGGVIHANVISMILEDDYIGEMSATAGVTLAVCLGLINVFLFKIVYGALPHWYDGLTKVFQLLEVMVLASLMIWLFNSYTYKINVTLSIIVVALSGDSIEVYHGVIKNLFDKERRKSLFKINKGFLEA